MAGLLDQYGKPLKGSGGGKGGSKRPLAHQKWM